MNPGSHHGIIQSYLSKVVRNPRRSYDSPHLTSPHRTKRTNKLTKLLVSVCGAVGLMALGALVLAQVLDNPTEIPRIIHYEGYLELNGKPVDWEEDTTMMLFTLSNNLSGVDSKFYQVPLKPKVEAGYFAVDIEIPNDKDHDWVFEQAKHVYLSMQVDGINLAGQQKIMPAPFAVRAAQADAATLASKARDFTVTDSFHCNSCVTTAGLQNGAVTNDKLAGPIAGDKLSTASVDPTKLTGNVLRNCTQKSDSTTIAAGSDRYASVSCNTNQIGISGGCGRSGSGSIIQSYSNGNGWVCWYGGTSAGTITAYVWCCDYK